LARNQDICVRVGWHVYPGADCCFIELAL
jgi:hypothetical protein